MRSSRTAPARRRAASTSRRRTACAKPKRQANGNLDGPCDPRDPQLNLVAKLVLENLFTEPLNSVSPSGTAARCQLGDYVAEHGVGHGVGGANKLFMTQVWLFDCLRPDMSSK